MFVKKEATERDRIRRKIRLIEGKQTKDKFRHLLSDVLKRLDEAKAYDRQLDPALYEELKRVYEDHRDLLQTTSKESILESLVLVEEDLEALIDDMKHTVAQASYNERLGNILKFLKDFNNTTYRSQVNLYEQASSKLVDQLASITKDLQYKLSRMTHQISQLTDEIKTLEDHNVSLAKTLSDTPQDSYKFKELAARMQEQHQSIELKDGSVSLMRKKASSLRLITHLFDQLTLLEDYHQYLKSDGYIRRLVKKLYRKPDQLDMMDNTADLVEVIQNIKKEIVDVESIVKPAKKMMFEDLEESVDTSLIEKYKSMAK